MKWMIRNVECRTPLGNVSEIIQLSFPQNLVPSDTILCHIHVFLLLIERDEFQREFS